jgi:hypothetical protein
VLEDDGDENFEDVEDENGEYMDDINLDINIDQLLGDIDMNGGNMDMNLLNLL